MMKMSQKSTFWEIIIFSRSDYFSGKNNFRKFFENFFHLEKIFFEKNFSPMSMQNFPRNPKIILRKLCDKAKDTKNQER